MKYMDVFSIPKLLLTLQRTHFLPVSLPFFMNVLRCSFIFVLFDVLSINFSEHLDITYNTPLLKDKHH